MDIINYNIIKDLDLDDRPREKLKKFGSENLTDKEILAIILKTGTKNLNVLDLSGLILKNIGGISRLREVTLKELMSFKGVGEVKAINILASIEFAKRLSNNKIENLVCFNAPDVVASYLKIKVEHLKQEVFIVLDLNTKGKLIEEREIFKGSLSSSIVHPREVYKYAIKNSASSIICVHNHPSGDATPSYEDIKTTIDLIECGNLLGIDLLDHIVIGTQGFCSIRKVIANLKSEGCLKGKDFSRKDISYVINKYKLVEDY